VRLVPIERGSTGFVRLRATSYRLSAIGCKGRWRQADTRSPNYAARFLDFADALEALFDRPVDVLTENMIGSLYFRQPVYDERRAPAVA
jgi:hypothetical protein